MNKTQFVELVQETGGFKTKVEAENAIKAFTEAVTKTLSKQDEITLVGFGSFSTSLQKGKSGTVPGTDRKYNTADKMVPRFKAGAMLKEKVATGK